MTQPPAQQQGFGPQPNFHNLIQSLNTVMNEATLIPNIPLVGQAKQLPQRIEARLVTIKAKLNSQPTQLFNSGARGYKPFIYTNCQEMLWSAKDADRSWSA